MKKHTKHYARRHHSASALHAHLVFVTKYRRRVMNERVFQLLRRAMRTIATRLGATITAIEADGDHLHLLVLYPPRLSISRLVQHLKGASSRAVRAQRLPEVVRRLWGARFWSASYCVVSCGGAPLEIVKTYVETQQARSTHPRAQSTPSPAQPHTPSWHTPSPPHGSQRHTKVPPGSPH